MAPTLVSVLFFAVAALAGGSPAEGARAEVADESPAWERTLDRVVPAVVALRVTATRDFDTEDAGSSVGTGFVVDAERGIILTNRHMVHAGPVIAEAVFFDHEEVELQPLYRDPVHDFGFYRFDPEHVRFMEVAELDLAPEAARVGMEIRVVGNDAGEKISILDGTLARLDRNVPDYGGNTYNDFNTFYLQAASNTSGGSSGSPVVDVHGRVVALNAGGSRGAASSFYLPLDRVVVALEAIQEGRPVPRGAIGTVFQYEPYDEVRRLGLRPETEAEVRAKFPQGTGMLVVSETIPGAQAWDELQSGDVLVGLDGRRVTGFVDLAATLDARVGESVTLDVERGGEPLSIAIAAVDDLHALSPDSYLEVGRAVLNDVSLTQARNHGVPVSGVYVAVPGFWLGTAGVSEGAILTEIDGVAVADLDAAQAELERKADGQRVRIRYHDIADPRRDQVVVATMDRLWYPMQRCTRDDVTGLWPCVESPAPPAAPVVSVQSGAPYAGRNRIEKTLAPSLVMVSFDVPLPTAGLKDFSFTGAGLVVDAGQGLVLVDRDTVPVALGEVLLTFGGSVRVPGEVVWLHPVHNLAVVRYDPALLGDMPVRSVVLSDKPARPGQKVWQVGLDQTHSIVSVDTTVESVVPLRLGIAGTPRFRDTNVEGIELRDVVPSLGGVVTDDRGRVLAIWASFVDQLESTRTFYGLPTSYVRPVVDPLRAGTVPTYRALGVDLAPVGLADARERGLSDARADELLAHDRNGRKVLEVERIWGATPAEALLREGDLIVAVDGAPVTRMREIEALHDAEQVQLTVLRDGQEVEIPLPTTPLDGGGVDQLVSWAGLVLHPPHHEVAAQQGVAPEGVYVAWMWYGSPAARYGLRPTRRIVEVDGVPTPDVAAFLDAVDEQADRQSVRVKMVGLDGKVTVATLKLDLHYWPTLVLERGADGAWARRRLADEVSASGPPPAQ